MPSGHVSTGRCVSRLECGSAAGDPLPGRPQDGERPLVEQVGHGRALHAAGEGVPDAGGAVVQVEAAVEERLDGVQLAAASVRVRPETWPAQEASCIAAAQGRWSARPSSTAARQAVAAGGVEPADGVEELGQLGGGRTEAGERDATAPRSSTRSKGPVSSRRTSGGSTPAAQ